MLPLLLSSDKAGHSWQWETWGWQNLKIQAQEVPGEISSSVHCGDMGVSEKVSQARQ